ncbi:MAG: NAD(P)-binding protein, partial [Salinarimonas sp.]
MSGIVHIVGAGIAGLSAAIAATEAGRAVHLYEAAPQAGGRCRTVTGADG